MRMPRDSVKFLGFMLLGFVIGWAIGNIIIGVFVGAVLFLCIRGYRGQGQ